MRLQEILKRQAELKASSETLTGKELDNCLAEMRSLNAEKEQIEKRSQIASMLSNGVVSGSAIETPVTSSSSSSEIIDKRAIYSTPEYRSAFFKSLAGAELNAVEKRALTTANGSAGVAVPTVTMNKIYEKIENGSIVYEKVTVSHLAGNIVIPYENAIADVQRKGEGESATIVDDTIDALRLGAKKYIKLVKLTCELENTAIDALEDFIVGRLSKKMMQAIDYDIINGTGNKTCTGILTTVTPIVTDGSKFKYDDICDLLIGSLNAQAKKNATLMMSGTTLCEVAKIKDEVKRPIFDIATGKLLMRDVVECDDVPDGVIIFGDFSEYMLNWAKDIEIAKSGENAFESGDTVYRALALVDGGLMDLGAMAVMQVGEDTPATPSQQQG